MKLLCFLLAALTLSSCSTPAWLAYNCVNETNESDVWEPIAVSSQDSTAMLNILDAEDRNFIRPSHRFWYVNQENVIRLCQVPEAAGHSNRRNPSCTTTSLTHFIRQEDGSFENVRDLDIEVVCVG